MVQQNAGGGRLLIVSERLTLEDDRLHLPDWVRAPLYLGHDARYFAALESSKRVNGNLEMVVSAIDPNLWDDIWRIEADTENSPGNALILFGLLEARGINVLAAESSVNTFSHNHSTTIIMSAAAYSSGEDLTQADRLKNAYPQLNELRSEIIAYLGDQLVFRPDGRPVLKVNHMRAYRKLSDDLRSGARLVLNRSGETLDNGSARLTPRAREHLSKAAGLEGLQYSPAVDTKDRLIRIIFYGQLQPRKHHVQIAVKAEMDGALRTVFELVYSAGGNVIRNNVRPCPPRIAQTFQRPSSVRAPYLDELQYKTIDLTFDLPGVTDEDLALTGLDAALGAEARTWPAGIVVLKKSWTETT